MGEEGFWIRLLGGFAVGRGERAVEDGAWRLRKAKTLVKLLALAPEWRLHSGEAAELLWPDRDAGASRNNLHQAIFAARRALGSTGLDGRRCLELREDVLVLCPDGGLRVDAAAFEDAAAAARKAGEVTAYRAALDAYGGELLPEDRYEEWSGPRREALAALRRTLAIELAELEAATDPEAAIGRLREAIVEQPLHEPAHRALMRLLADLGRRQEALAQFQELKQGLRREYEDEPDDETRRLYQEILTRRLDRAPGAAQVVSEAPEAVGPSPSRLPEQLTSFIGRERELAEVDVLLGSSRLLTLTGAGGCGKTRLAYELAGTRGDFPDGILPVELAALGEPSLVGPAVAQAMDVRLASGRAPEEALAAHVGEREQLLLLDNCEHLVEPVARLAEALLRQCPNLTVLATSREPLRVPGEVTWRVPSLSLPPLDGDAGADRGEAESVRLFSVRAAQAAPGFELGAENAAPVAALCHRLDGMPLAIELAAAQAGSLSPAQIVERLDDSLDLLATGSRTAMTRQQTLRATLAWSYDLLDDEERVLLRRLAVFAAGFGLQAAEDVCAEPPLDRGGFAALLGRLADKSLVQVEGGPRERRYRLLETVRQYAAERLREAGERQDFEWRHREWYLDLAESDPTPDGDLPSRESLRRLELERDNLRAALTSAVAADPQVALRLAVALWRFWLMRGYLAEGHSWLQIALEAAPEQTVPRGRALAAACLIGLRRGVHEGIHEQVLESIALFAELGEPRRRFDAIEICGAYRAIFCAEAEIEELVGEHGSSEAEGVPAARAAAWGAHTSGLGAWLRRDYPRARDRLGLARERLGELTGERRAALWPLSYGLISVEPELGYPLSLHEETVLVARRVGGEAAVAYVLVNLAAVERAVGEVEPAAELIEESLARFRQLGDVPGEAVALNAAGNLDRARGDFERGKGLLERSLAIRQRVGDRRGAGITLGCLALLDARAGDPDGGRAAAGQASAWFVENDDMIGLSAAELSLTCIELCAGERAAARAHLESAAELLRRMAPSHQEAWVQAVLAAIAIEDGEPGEARLWLERAGQLFERLGGERGAAYCASLAAGSAAERPSPQAG